MRFTNSEPRLRFSARGQGEPVLLIMGLGMAGDVWEPQVRLLEDRFRLIWFDNRGSGDSARPRGPLSMRALAADAVRVLDETGHRRAHVVGVSMGGMIAQELALRCRDRVQTLSLIATHAGGLRSIFPSPRGLKHFVGAQWGKPSARARALSRLLYTEEFLQGASAAQLQDRFQLMGRTPVRRRDIVAQLCAVLRHDTRRKLPELGCPTLVIRGRDDVLIRPKTTGALAQHLKQAKLIELSPAGHGLIFERARDVAAELASHFDAHSVAGAGGASPQAPEPGI